MCSITIEHSFLSFLLWFLKCILLEIGSFFSKKIIKKNNHGVSPHTPLVGLAPFACLQGCWMPMTVEIACIHTASTSLGGIPGRIRTFRASRQVAMIWIWEECHIQRERKRQHRDVRDTVVSERVLFLKRETDRTEQEKPEKDCAHTSQREKECAPTEKAYMLGLLTHLGVATRLARRAFAIRLAHVWTITKPCLETLDHRSQHSRSLLRIRPLETRQDGISTDLLEDSDDVVWYALVGASCSRSCPSRRISWLYRRKPAPLCSPGTSWVCWFFFWREIFVLPALVILY